MNVVTGHVTYVRPCFLQQEEVEVQARNLHQDHQPVNVPLNCQAGASQSLLTEFVGDLRYLHVQMSLMVRALVGRGD